MRRCTPLMGPVAALLVYAMATPQFLYATYSGKNGQIVFTQYDSTGSQHIMITNPDGTQEHELILPNWGTHAFQ